MLYAGYLKLPQKSLNRAIWFAGDCTNSINKGFKALLKESAFGCGMKMV